MTSPLEPQTWEPLPPGRQGASRRRSLPGGLAVLRGGAETFRGSAAEVGKPRPQVVEDVVDHGGIWWYMVVIAVEAAEAAPLFWGLVICSDL